MNLFIEFFSDAVSPLDVDLVDLARTVDIGQFDAHLHRQQPVGFVGPVDAWRPGVVHFDVKLGQDFKMAFKIGGQDGLDDQETEALELSTIQVHQEIVARIRQ